MTALTLAWVLAILGADPPSTRSTEVSIRGEDFLINGQLTYPGRTWRGHRIEGLLLNSRMVQATFDDRNPTTRSRWAYPDTRKWDPERNVREFLAALPVYRNHGLLAVTVNFQGGNPERYTRDQPWLNSAFEDDGTLRADALDRMGRVLDRLDELGMVAIVGIFYFGQDQRFKDEATVLKALDGAIDWILKRGYRNILIEVNNECNVRYDHDVLKPDRVHELILRVRERSTAQGRRLLVGTSYGGGTIPGERVVRASDFLLLHGNGVDDPARIAAMVDRTRAVPGYRPMPILFNEDDHFRFDEPKHNFAAAISKHASWGYFDPGENNYRDGYQSPPVDWRINTERKRAFFDLVETMTGGAPVP